MNEVDRCLDLMRAATFGECVSPPDGAGSGIRVLSFACQSSAEAPEILQMLEALNRLPKYAFENCSDGQIEALSKYLISFVVCSHRDVNYACLALLKRLAKEKSMIMNHLLNRGILQCLVENALSDRESFPLYLNVTAIIISNYHAPVDVSYRHSDFLKYSCRCLEDKGTRKLAAKALAVFAQGEMPRECQVAILGATKSVWENSRDLERVVLIPRGMIRDKETAHFILEEMGFGALYSQLMSTDRESLKEAAITTVGRHYLYSNTLIDFPYLELGPCALSTNASLASSAIWMLSNIIASSPAMIDELEEKIHLCSLLLHAVENGSASAKMEAYLAMVSIVCQGNNSQVSWCVDHGCVEMFLNVIDTENPKWVLSMLRALSRLFKHVDRNIRQRALNQFAELDGSGRIAALLDSDDKSLATAAERFCSTFKV